MTDTLLTPQLQEEALSRAYAHAVAAQAGFSTAVYAEDQDGIDLRIQAGGEMRPALELQLKATINLRSAAADVYKFPLKKRNYNLLRISTQTPRILVVLDLPRDKHQWMAITDQELVLRHRAYWKDLKGAEETAVKDNVTVDIPKENIFDVAALRMLMERSRTGSIQ